MRSRADEHLIAATARDAPSSRRYWARSVRWVKRGFSGGGVARVVLTHLQSPRDAERCRVDRWGDQAHGRNSQSPTRAAKGTRCLARVARVPPLLSDNGRTDLEDRGCQTSETSHTTRRSNRTRKIEARRSLPVPPRHRSQVAGRRWKSIRATAPRRRPQTDVSGVQRIGRPCVKPPSVTRPSPNSTPAERPGTATVMPIAACRLGGTAP